MESIDDLASFVEGLNSGKGVNRLIRFMATDDQQLVEAGGCYDET